jgi:hypothetical protein
LSGRMITMSRFVSSTVPGVVAAGGCCCGGIAVALEVGADVVADFDVGGSFDFLGCQAAVADELAGGFERDPPESEAFLAIEAAADTTAGGSCPASVHNGQSGVVRRYLAACHEHRLLDECHDGVGWRASVGEQLEDGGRCGDGECFDVIGLLDGCRGRDAGEVFDDVGCCGEPVGRGDGGCGRVVVEEQVVGAEGVCGEELVGGGHLDGGDVFAAEGDRLLGAAGEVAELGPLDGGEFRLDVGDDRCGEVGRCELVQRWSSPLSCWRRPRRRLRPSRGCGPFLAEQRRGRERHRLHPGVPWKDRAMMTPGRVCG